MSPETRYRRLRSSGGAPGAGCCETPAQLPAPVGSGHLDPVPEAARCQASRPSFSSGESGRGVCLGYCS